LHKVVELQQVSTSSIRSAFDWLLHKSVQGDALGMLRHRAFIASRLIAFCVGLSALPFCLFAWGPPEFVDTLLIAGLSVPLIGAILLSRTGNYEIAQLISAAGSLVMIGCLAWQTDGLNSFLIGWMIVTLVEAALSGSSRVFTFALSVAGVLALALSLAAYNWMLPEPQAPLYTVLALLAAAISFIGNAYGLSAGFNEAHAEQNGTHRVIADRYRMMVEHAADMVSLHTRSGNLLFASNAAKNIIGESDAQLFDRVHVQDRPAFLKMFEHAGQNNKPAMLEFRLQCDGAYKWVEMHCAPMSGGEGVPLQFVAITREIIKYEDAHFNEAADKAQVERNRMLAQLSHELRTPLNAMLGFAEILSGRTGAPLTTRTKNHYATLIHLAGSHLLDVVNSVLDAGKAGAGAFTIEAVRFQPAQLVDECLTLMEKQAVKAGVSLKKTQMRAIPEIYADPRACKQILLNLIQNGIKFTPSGGSVMLGLSANEESVTLIVSDTGIGIDKKDIAKLGQPFARLDHDVPGSGLGLSLVKNFAEMQGGSLSISSQVGRGTVVSVILPRCVKQSAAQEDRQAEEAAPALKAVG
jgi:cell cycle sensor histidine kinase DivJ